MEKVKTLIIQKEKILSPGFNQQYFCGTFDYCAKIHFSDNHLKKHLQFFVVFFHKMRFGANSTLFIPE